MSRVTNTHDPAASGHPHEPERERVFSPAPRVAAAPRVRSSLSPGTIPLVIAVLLLLVMAVSPSPYVLRQPGPVFNAVGDVVLEEGADAVPVITISGADSYAPESGRLDVMTVNVAGSPQGMPGWIEALIAYATDERDVLPIELYYPEGETAEERTTANETMMRTSQGEAIAAALIHEGYEVNVNVVVAEVGAGGAAVGLLQAGDRLVEIDGTPIDSFDAVTNAIAGNPGTPVIVTVDRKGVMTDVEVTPRIETPAGETDARPLLGIVVAGAYDFPVDVDIELGSVGGPSAGLIFALSIIELLTPGEMTGGLHFAGTGTIAADGTVGPIGGIRQKLAAAADAGAVAFLAPVENCAESIDGGVPGDLPVYAVTTLEEAVTAVETIASGEDTSGLPTCQNVGAASEAAVD